MKNDSENIKVLKGFGTALAIFAFTIFLLLLGVDAEAQNTCSTCSETTACLNPAANETSAIAFLIGMLAGCFLYLIYLNKTEISKP